MPTPSRALHIPWIVILICLLGLGLRVHTLARQELWGDEAMTTCLLEEPLGQVLRAGIDTHPPLYYLATHLWSIPAGTSVFALRYLSAIIGVLAITVFYRLGSLWGGSAIGALSALLYAVSPLDVYYSQELRMYGLLALMTLGSMAALCGWLRDKHPRPWVLVAYFGTTLAAIYTHYQAFAVLGVQAIVVLLSQWGAPRHDRVWIRHWLYGVGALALAYLPWVLAQGPHLAARGSQAPYALSVSRLATIVRGGLQSYLLGTMAPPRPIALAILAVGGVLALAGIRALWSARRDSPQGIALARFWALPLIWLGGVWVAWWLADPLMPFYHPRFVLAAAPALLLLIAAGLVWLGRRRRWVGALALLAMLAGSGRGLAAWYDAPLDEKGDYGRTMAAIGDAYLPGDVLLLTNRDQLCLFRYYQPKMVPWALITADDTHKPERAAEALPRLTSGYRRAWLLTFGPTEISDPDRLAERWLAAHGYNMHYQSHRGFYLNLYVLADPPASPTVPLDVHYGDGIALQGYDVWQERAGGVRALLVTLYWKATSLPGADYTVFTQLLDQAGAVVAQFDGPPANGARPTSGWHLDEDVIDTRALTLDALAPGRYTLWVGLYTWPDLVRLPLADGSGDAALVATLDLG